jgi:hypothetical protein
VPFVTLWPKTFFGRISLEKHALTLIASVHACVKRCQETPTFSAIPHLYKYTGCLNHSDEVGEDRNGRDEAAQGSENAEYLFDELRRRRQHPCQGRYHMESVDGCAGLPALELNDGQIRQGEQIRLHVPGTDRTFTPKISDVVACERMTWTGGLAPLFKGVRTFKLTPRNDGSTDFAMEERFAGLMLPLVKGSLPDFGPVFERYANDLKHEAERAKG